MAKNLSTNLSSAVLDKAHVGDIRGTFGTIKEQDFAPRKTWWARFRTLLAIMGPGLIVMVGDNDAGGVATYAQAEQNYGTSLLWVLLLLIPILIVNQEMVVRLGLVTGVGHAKLIFERFGRFWGAFSVGDLFLVNCLTLVTEFIGIDLAMSYFEVPPYISVPVAAVLLIACTMTGSFRKWESIMYLFIVSNLLTFPLAFMSRPNAGSVIHDFVVPHIQGGLNSDVMLLIISMVGTTVAPWQLFFQQSNVIDKRLTLRWMAYERADTIIGAFIVVIGAAALIMTTAFAFHGTNLMGHFVDAGTISKGLAAKISPLARAFFAFILLNASLIGAAAVTLSTSYAFGDVFGVNHSLHRSVKEARGFYLSYGVLIFIAAGIVLIPHAPLGLITTAVQALAGILLPSATVFLLLLCNDKDVLGPWVNKMWLNVVNSIIVGVLVILSLILAVTTLYPHFDIKLLTEVLSGALIFGLTIAGFLYYSQKSKTEIEKIEKVQPAIDRHLWRMKPLNELQKPEWSKTRKLGMLLLRGYLLIAVILIVVKVVQLALGTH